MSPINDPSGIPDTPYTRFALNDPQSAVINGRFREQSETPNPKFREAGNKAVVSQLSNVPHSVNPVTFYDRDVPYKGPTTYLRIQPAGEKLNIVDRPAVDGDCISYPSEYQAYLAGKPQRPNGTPLSVLGLPAQQIKDLEYNHIYTIEQGATLSDQALHALSLHDFQRKCLRYCDYARSQKLLDDKDEQIAQLKARIKELEAKSVRQKPRID